jgi:hypothetical protein
MVFDRLEIAMPDAWMSATLAAALSVEWDCLF